MTALLQVLMLRLAHSSLSTTGQFSNSSPESHGVPAPESLLQVLTCLSPIWGTAICPPSSPLMMQEELLIFSVCSAFLLP